MKKIFLILLFILSVNSIAQEYLSEYKVEYSYYTPFDFELSKDTLSSYLLFNNNVSLFKIDKKEFDPKTINFDENQKMIGSIVKFSDEVYKNFNDNYMLSFSDVLYQKKVTLTQPLNDLSVLSINEEFSKKILGYLCKSAVVKYKGRLYDVYFAPSLGKNMGPWKLHGLDGIILEVKEKSGLLYIKAKKVYKYNEEIEKKQKNSNTWEKVIQKASMLYSRHRQKLIRCCSQNPSIDTSGSLEMYELNPNIGFELNYEVYMELEENSKYEKSLVSHFSLETSSYESNYKYIDRIINDQDLTEFGYISETGILYKNLIDSALYQDKELSGKKFLIDDKMPIFDWKILKETKEIIGYKSYKAITNYNGNYLIAWFTYDIPINNGPDIYFGLPGLILEIEVHLPSKNEMREIWYYKAAKLKRIDVGKLIKPSSGQKVSLSEFQKIQKELYDKTMDLYGGGVDTD